MDIDLIVPGHGSVVKKDVALKPILKYFTRLISQVRKFHKDNVSLQESINSILQREILDSKKLILRDGLYLQNIIILMLQKFIQN